ncbi:MAG: ATP-binding protein [Accumulibacter sp.]|jgi:hypothetical protein|uniref:ATP-binding protein n=1 Tax=Accumulibacter sp. TaxID=2053492 RepID=UPI002FC390A2
MNDIKKKSVLFGLPDDVLQPDGKSIVLIKLLQAKGLNRDVKRKLSEHSKGADYFAGMIAESLGERVAHLAEADKQLVRRWSNPMQRMGSFWAARRAGPAGRDRFTAMDYAQSVDLVFLEEYDSDWTALTFDEETLLDSCTDWRDIRSGIERAMGSSSAKLSFNVFMLWPQIAEELERWPELDDVRRRAVSHAVFALCSASANEWFARRAIGLCPDLSSDFQLVDQAVQPEQAEQAPVAGELSPAGFQADWDALMERLDQIRDELRRCPSMQSVADLMRIGEEFGVLAAHLPVAEDTLREEIKAKVDALIKLCHEWSGKPEFAWLDEAVLLALEKRWEDALGEPEASLEELSVDANAALERTSLAGATFESEAGGRQTLQESHDALDRQVRAAKSSLERKPIERKRRERERALLDLDEKLESLQDAFLSAASPYCRSFETQEHDPRQFEGEECTGGVAVAPVEPALAVMPGEPEEVPPPSVTEPMPEDEPQIQPLPAPGIEPVSEPTPDPAPEPSPKPLAEHVMPARTEVSHGIVVAGGAAPESTREEMYSPDAGEACRPIWTLLGRGNLSMAYQYARALTKANGGIRTPPLELLESLALAHSLVFPDGRLRESVAARLQNLSEAWFHEDGPHSWHTALNLLLVAATLRPMVLCPESGASAIAGYLHLDSQGRYKSLYLLVQALRESSERLLRFRIELASIRSARSQAAISKDFSGLQAEARDWLRTQAPAMTIKFAPATKVWHAWLKPEGVMSRLVSPVAENKPAAVAEVKGLIRSLSDQAELRKLIRKTDRTENGRVKGEDIHSGALDHLGRCAQEALGFARRWTALVEAQSPSSDQMRKLLLQVREKLDQSMQPIESELVASATDQWGLVASAQAVVWRELQALHGLFDPESPLPASEPPADQVIVGELLLVPEIRVGANWSVETPETTIVSAIRTWTANPVSLGQAFEQRLHVGDVFGANLLLQGADDEDSGSDTGDSLRRARDSWCAKLKASLLVARRDIEVGSAYGYVSDAERSSWESGLVFLEAQTAEQGRFDVALSAISDISAQIRGNHDKKAGEVGAAISDLAGFGKDPADLAEVEKALRERDIATANELLQRVRRGLPPWPDEAVEADPFHSFLAGIGELEDWLSSRRSKESIDTTIKKGESIPGLELGKVDGAQRDQAAKMFTDWAQLKSRREAEAIRLQSFFSGLGFVLPNPPSRESKTPKMEVWNMSTGTVEDRGVCPIPHFGSGAKGNYRVICLWERPTEDDIVQMVGDSSLHRATIVLYFGRMSERKWRDISRKTKLAHKSFVLMDEVMLLFLAGQGGSRLAAFFSTSLPFGYSDPYDATAGLVPPEMFFGRTSELNAILGMNGRCFIYGGRQLGKTALMRRAEQAFHAPPNGRYSIWIDLRAEGIGVNRAAFEIWLPLAASLRGVGALGSPVSSASLAKKGGVDTLVDEVRTFLVKNVERRILLLLDEADRFFEQDGRHDFAETRRLKQLMDVTQRRFKVVFAGLHNVFRMTERANHPMAHFGEPIKIGPFIDEHEIREAQELVRKPLLAAGFEFDAPSLVIRILAQTNYYPSLIQLYCHHLLRHMLTKVGSAQRPHGPRYRITNQDIEAVYSSGDLRDEIRNKFRLTLQLDLRYEVVAYAMALEALSGRYTHNEGMDWRSIWQNGAMQWWPEGFHDTSELDFRVLLDEMVALGVLSRTPEGRYSLRNPNIFLLLGNQEEIETVLVKSRQPTGEFDSAAFRAHFRDKPDSPQRNPLTYQQLSELLRHENSVLALAGSLAGGSAGLIPALKDYLDLTGSGVLVEIDGCGDHLSFANTLKRITRNKQNEGLTVIVVPNTVPWSGIWVRDAKRVLDGLHMANRFVSLVFVADPEMMWGALADEALQELEIPWMSMLPWRESFVRQWLEDLKLPNATGALGAATGFWPTLLYSLIEEGITARELDRRIEAIEQSWKDPEEVRKRLADFGLNVRLPQQILTTLANWGEQPAEASELAEMSECGLDQVERALRWAERIGLAKREGGDFWVLDPVVRRTLLAVKI